MVTQKVIWHRKRSDDYTKCGDLGVRNHIIVSLGMCERVTQIARVQGLQELDTTNIIKIALK